MKGQNLRIMLDNKVVAGSTSCNFHVAAQVEDCSTKDSTGNWKENEVVGNSWDAQVDSLVVLREDEWTIQDTTPSEIHISQATYFLYDDWLTIPAHATINITAIGGCYGLALLSSPTTVIAQTQGAGVNHLSHTNDTDSAARVQVAQVSYNNECSISYGFLDPNANYTDGVFGLLTNGTLVAVKFAPMTGDKNRTQDTGSFYYGNARVMDITLNGNNRQRATYSVKLVGEGSLAIGPVEVNFNVN